MPRRAVLHRGTQICAGQSRRSESLPCVRGGAPQGRRGCACSPSHRTSGGHEVRREPFARSARTQITARSALFNPAPAGAFSLFHISLFQKEKYGRRRPVASTCRMRIRLRSCPLSRLAAPALPKGEPRHRRRRLSPPQFPLDIPSRVRYL